MKGNNRDILEGKVVSEAYAASVEPLRYDELMRAWESYISLRIDASPNGISDESEEDLRAHFDRAHTVFERMEGVGLSQAELQQVVDSVSGMGMLVDKTGAIIVRNSHCEWAALDYKNVSELPIDSDCKQNLESWIRGDQLGKSRFLFTPYFSQNKEGCFLVTLIDRKDMPNLNREGGSAHSIDYYLISSIELRIRASVLKQIRQVYGLSVSEAEVARDLTNGMTPAEIAEARSASIHTVRTQIKMVLQKTYSKSSSDLVRKLCAFAANDSIVAGARSEIEPSRSTGGCSLTGTLKLRDGRQLAYTEQGDLAGRPVLFFHNMLYGVEWSADAVSACKKAGWRIIAPSRPGYGKTDLHRKASGSDLIDVAIDDASQLIAHLGISEVIIIGHVMGSIYAQRFCNQYSAVAKGLLLISHAPFWQKSLFADLPRRQQLLAYTTYYTPFALPLITRAGVELIKSGRADLFIDALHKDIPADRQALEDKTVYSAVVKGLNHTVERGSRGFCNDCPIVLTNWLEESKQLQLPIRVVHGEGDQLVTGKYIDAFHQAVPQAQIVWISGAGQFLLFSHWPSILQQLEAF